MNQPAETTLQPSPLALALFPRWQAAVEGVLKSFAHVMLLDRPSDAAAAFKLAEQLRFPHFIVPQRVTAPKVNGKQDGSLYAVVQFSAPVPSWLIDQLQRIVRIDSIAEGMQLSTTNEWITPEAFHSERRGGRSLFVDVARYRFGHAGRAQRLEALQAMSGTAPRVVVSTGKLVGEGFDHAPLDTLFLAMPVAFDRPGLATTTPNFAEWALQLVYGRDPPWNCMPSTHCAVAMLSALALLETGRGVGWFGMFTAAAIGVSTLYTKQHYVVDVLAGFTLAAVTWKTLQWIWRNPAVVPEPARALIERDLQAEADLAPRRLPRKRPAPVNRESLVAYFRST